MPMYLYLGDITRMETDAIVNAAGTDLRRCPGICDAIFAAADTEELERACRKLGRCRIGQAVATPGCGLPCRYIIHVAGPGWYGGEPRERFLLAGCYQNALHKAYLCQLPAGGGAADLLRRLPHAAGRPPSAWPGRRLPISASAIPPWR